MKKIITLFFVVCFVFSAYSQTVKNFTSAKPESVGMSTERLSRIDKLMHEVIEKKYLAGSVVFVARDGKIVYHKAYGYDDIEKKTELKKDNIFRIASQTKAITSIAVMMLYEEGKFNLDDPVSKYIPEFKKPVVMKTFNEKDSTYTSEPAKREITIRQLLTHTSGIGYAQIGTKEMRAIYAKAGVPSGVGNIKDILSEKMKILGKQPLMHEPGEKFSYGLSIDVLGYLVEIWSGMSLDEFFKQRIFVPLGMDDTYFYLPKEKQSRLVKLYEEKDGMAKMRTESVEGDPNYPCFKGTYFSGGAGLSGTIEDYAKFLQMLLNGGTYNGKRLLGKKTVELILTNQLSDKITTQWGLGFELETAKTDYMSPASIGTFSWGGMFNTSYWVDPQEKLVYLMYTQIYPTTNGRIADKFKALVYQSIEK
jgi:CubicO group peptidase (beta-lactamase class C family)